MIKLKENRNLIFVYGTLGRGFSDFYMLKENSKFLGDVISTSKLLMCEYKSEYLES